MDAPRNPDDAIDGAQWELLHDFFDRMLESDQPEAVLSSITDPVLRAQAERLWRDHIEAGEERFLADPVQFDVVPVFAPGQALAGRFEVERLLGRGGMGEVYLAWDRVLNERVAIKTIARLLLPSESMRRRFLTEVQSARRVTHRNVCRIHDLFEEESTPFFAMEYVDGKPLNELPAETSGKDKAKLVQQLADGLAAAHANGIIHGDFKPGNILVASCR